jgi:hypothetical protein
MTFTDWLTTQFSITADEMDALHLVNAFEILVCRCEAARRLGSPDPLVTASPKRAGGNSRQVTRRMLSQLGYDRTQLRVIHRLLAGSTGGWPGLLALYATQATATEKHRIYVRKQLQLCRPESSRRRESGQLTTTRTGPSPG